MNQYVNTNSNVTHHDLYLTGALKRDLITVANSGGGVFDVNPSDGDAFLINAVNGTQIQMNSIVSANIGQSGTIVIINGIGSSFFELPANMKTPSGARVEFALNDGAVSIISYFILSTESVLVNYIGDFV